MSITLGVTFLAIVKLFLVSLGGYLVVRLRIFSKGAVKDLARLILYVNVPCLLFVKMFHSFKPSLLRELAVIPLSAFLMTALAGVLALVGMKLFRIASETRNIFSCMVLFGNSGYIPIPLVMSVLPENQASQGVVYISLFLLVFSPLLWTVGVYLMGRDARVKLPMKKLFSPPMAGILCGLLAAAIPPVKTLLTHHAKVIIKSADLIGEATVPLAMILIGAVMATLDVKARFRWNFLIGVFFLKMVALPVITLGILYVLPLPNLVRFIIALEAMVPPATNLVVIAKTYNKSAELVSLSLFVTYLISMITVPLLLFLTTLLFPI